MLSKISKEDQQLAISISYYVFLPLLTILGLMYYGLYITGNF